MGLALVLVAGAVVVLAWASSVIWAEDRFRVLVDRIEELIEATNNLARVLSAGQAEQEGGS